jgi:hypothetical protein
VPVVGATLLGVAGAAAGWDERGRAADARRLAAVAGQAVAAAHELQEERVRAVAWMSAAGRVGGRGPAGQGGPVDRALVARRGRVDRALAAYRAGAAGLGPAADPALDQAVAVAAGRLDRLALVRAEVDRALATPEQAMAGLDQMVAVLLGVTGELAHRLDAPAAARAARLLLAVASAKEATGRERSLLATSPAQTRDQVLRARLTAAAAVARYELIGVRAAAGDRLDLIDRALAAPGVRRVRRLELGLLQPAAGPPAVGDPEAWRAGLGARAGALRRVEREVAGDLDEALAALAATLLLLGVLAGRAPGPEAAAAATVPGLARRGQALAVRQLQLLEELVRDEADPDRRRDLLGVDHLATRLRRTSETLLAMTGPDPARRWARPVPLDLLLRAAAAEAEGLEHAGAGGPKFQGRRVDLLTTGEVEVAGAAAVDLVHLLAELLDNAAAGSPPAAPVVVTAAGEGDGHLIEVADRGFGMTDQELAWANRRLAGGSAADPAGRAADDRLGLLVVARNGFGVRLDRSPAGGVIAAVRLPAELLSARTPAPARPR